MLEPINARFASSCSRNGIRPAATETSCSAKRPCSPLGGFDINEVASATARYFSSVKWPCRRSAHWPAQRENCFLAIGGEIIDLMRHAALFHFAIRRFDKAEIIDRAQRSPARRSDRCSDLRAFQSDKCARSATDERRALQIRHGRGQTARPKGRQTALVRQFREWINLIHELRQAGCGQRNRGSPPTSAFGLISFCGVIPSTL